MRDYQHEGLVHDPLHGYIPFTSTRPTGGSEVTGSTAAEGETCERELIDHPWVQRLRQIHQLQTAWYVFPSAEHTRFQHVLGVMHLASRVIETLYPSLAETCPDVPSRGYVESLMRVAGLLHDVGHGPFGHFLDDYFLADFGLTHETLGATIIQKELGPLIRRLRRNPNSRLRDDETLLPDHVALLIQRPKTDDADRVPRWLRNLRSLFSGIYTVDNMDFVLRDAYMSGYSTRSFDLDRLLHYSFFSAEGLTLHQRGLSALVRFISARAELFRAIYFHRTVRALDLALQDLFVESKGFLFPGSPLENLDGYRRFTEWSLLGEVAAWPESDDPRKRAAGERWREFLARKMRWRMAHEHTAFYPLGASEQTSIFSQNALFETALRHALLPALAALPLRVDIARHVHRPGTRGPTAGQNFMFDPATESVRPLVDHELFRQIPLSFRIVRVYTLDSSHDAEIAAAMGKLLDAGPDDKTNM